jgi:hypothetical protein
VARGVTSVPILLAATGLREFEVHNALREYAMGLRCARATLPGAGPRKPKHDLKPRRVPRGALNRPRRP